MKGFILSVRSEKNLIGVRRDLQRAVRRAIKINGVDCVVTEGVRTMSRQQELLRAGATRTLKSRHLTGHAVDLAAVIGTSVRWDWPPSPRLTDVMQEAAKEWEVRVEWGGHWKSFKDGPHFQLSWREYPA